jgi:hypothetical protein
VSGFSLYETYRNNRLSHQAFVRAKVIFPIAKERYTTLPREAQVSIPMEVRILNHGTLIAHDISLEYLITLRGKELRHITEKVTSTNKITGESSLPSIDPGDEQTYPMTPLKITVGDFLDALDGKVPLSICTQVNFRDENHSEKGQRHCTFPIGSMLSNF